MKRSDILWTVGCIVVLILIVIVLAPSKATHYYTYHDHIVRCISTYGWGVDLISSVCFDK